MNLSEQKAGEWRRRIRESGSNGRLYLIDGPSGSGKTTMTDELLAEPELDLHFIPRHCTREPRSNEESEYVFVSAEAFQESVDQGEFLESKDFLFGMSYGLMWSELTRPLLEGHNALALMNWGNAEQVKALFPEARIILITASIDVLRRRLMSRGIHDEGQLEERLGNARRIQSTDAHDLIIMNEDGALEESLAQIKAFVKQGE
ncbi:MAG: hypothetical protein AAF492_10435 [Verrucomicrobiota bacterium]